MSQLDIFRNDRAREAEAYRQAAATALVDPHYPPHVQRERHDYYAGKATEMERDDG